MNETIRPNERNVAGSVPAVHSDRVAALALVSSFIVIVALSGILVYWGWKDADTAFVVGRYAVFAVFVAAMHVIGYRLWQQQHLADRAGDAKLASSPISPAYESPVKVALLEQAIVFILAAMVLDMGETLHAVMVAVVAYWLAFGVVLFRRPGSPTPGDLRLVRHGFLLVFLIVFTVGLKVWHAMGRC
jgi:hypothetical protein